MAMIETEESVDALTTAGKFAEAISLVLSRAPPSQRWSTTAAAVAVDGASSSSSSSSSIAPSSSSARQALQLQSWALRELRRVANPDQSLAALHAALLQATAAHGGGGRLAGGASWFRWRWLEDPGGATDNSSTLTSTAQLAAAAWHLSPSPQDAWVGLAQALSHGLTLQPHDPYLARGGTGSRSRSSSSKHHSPRSRQSSRGARSTRSVALEEDEAPSKWLPAAAVKHIEDLQSKQAEVIRRLLAGQRRSSATLEADLTEAARAALPATHLQLVGQRLLAHARAQLPALLALPGAPPRELLAALYGRPFAAAVGQALQAIASDPLGNPSPFVPVPHAPGPRAAVRGFRRIYAAPRVAPSEGSRSRGGGRDARGRANLGVLAAVCRDVQVGGRVVWVSSASSRSHHI
jgi:hypothetical protein